MSKSEYVICINSNKSDSYLYTENHNFKSELNTLIKNRIVLSIKNTYQFQNILSFNIIKRLITKSVFI